MLTPQERAMLSDEPTPEEYREMQEQCFRHSVEHNYREIHGLIGRGYNNEQRDND